MRVFFFPSPQPFRRPCPHTDTSITLPSYRDSLPSQMVALLFAPIELISAFWGKNYALSTVFYDPQCSSLEGHSAQCLSVSFRVLADSIFYPTVPASGQPGEITFNSITLSPAVVLFYNLLSCLLSPVCPGWEGGRSAPQICSLTRAIMCTHVETDVCERSFPGRDLICVWGVFCVTFSIPEIFQFQVP